METLQFTSHRQTKYYQHTGYMEKKNIEFFRTLLFTDMAFTNTQVPIEEQKNYSKPYTLQFTDTANINTLVSREKTRNIFPNPTPDTRHGINKHKGSERKKRRIFSKSYT